MEQSAIARVDARLDPIKRVKEKHARAELETVASDEAQSPANRLRACLSIGKVPPSNLVTEENIIAALNVDDRVRFLSKLSRNVKLLRAEIPLTAVSRSLKDFGPRSAHRAATALSRIAKKWDSQSPSAELSEPAIQWFLRVVEGLLRHHRSGGVRNLQKDPFVVLAKIAAKWAAASMRSDVVRAALRILSSLESKTGMSIDKISDDAPDFLKSLQTLAGSAIQELQAFGTQGRASELVESAELVRVIPSGRREVELKLSEMYNQKARFPESIQEALRTLHGETTTVKGALRIDLDDEEATRTTQLASALIAAWAARSDGAGALEAYDELTSVAASFFGLHLHGEVGDVEEYNPRLHEFASDSVPAGRVRLLRPWVEFSRQDRSKIILKAPVEAAEAPM